MGLVCCFFSFLFFFFFFFFFSLSFVFFLSFCLPFSVLFSLPSVPFFLAFLLFSALLFFFPFFFVFFFFLLFFSFLSGDNPAPDHVEFSISFMERVWVSAGIRVQATPSPPDRAPDMSARAYVFLREPSPARRRRASGHTRGRCEPTLGGAESSDPAAGPRLSFERPRREGAAAR